ncbi:MAG: hypothetical protein VZS44_11600 [Bacilli bacterium]|nr:hypothetical protein [Bacilli bacterium]
MKNDQQELIQLLKEQEYDCAWEYCKWIGYKIIPDMEERLMYFQPIAEIFDYNKNNNFIGFYMERLRYIKAELNSSILTTKNKHMIQDIIRHRISPETEDEERSRTLKVLQNWENGDMFN